MPRYVLQPIDEEPLGELGPIPPHLARQAPKGFRYVIAPPTPPSLEELKAAALQAVRDRRWQAENAGVTVGGVRIRTDERTQAKVSGALQLMELNPAIEALDWEATPGVFAALDQSALVAVGLAIGAHVQACFTNSKVLSLAIAAAEDAEALTAINLQAGWPD